MLDPYSILCVALFILYTEIALFKARRPRSDKIIAALFGISFPILFAALMYAAFAGLSSPVTSSRIWIGLYILLTAIVLWRITGHSRRVLLGLALATLASATTIILCFAYLPPGARRPCLIVAALLWHTFVAVALFKWARSVEIARWSALLPCPHCDYSLLGLPESTTRCPECGADFTLRAPHP